VECRGGREENGSGCAVGIGSKLLFADVMHKRLFPKENQFRYKVYYHAFDVEELQNLSDGVWFGVDRWGLASFHQRDHGPCDGTSLSNWAMDLVNRFTPESGIEKIVLVAMPRLFGYGFNPVSFWLCLDAEGSLRSVIAEVHNTFGERHVYFCRKEDGSTIDETDQMEALKQFHVSPFMERNGHYRFRYDYREGHFSVWIDYYDKDGRKQLLTSLSGEFCEDTRRSRLLAFLKCPLVTIKTITLIHWQALRLVMKGIKYIPRPKQLANRIAVTGNITKS
jgi:DUF1365 family protein